MYLSNRQDSEQIVGVWISDDDPNWKMEFKGNGTCTDIYQGVISDTYSYEIWSRPSSNGNLTITMLRLTKTKSSESKIYEINALNQAYLTLEYVNLPGKLIRFSRL